MSLYSNILCRSQDDEADQANRLQEKSCQRQTPSASMRLLQDHLMSKKRSKQSISRQSLEWDLDDEYDPSIPNSYEILRLEQVKAEERRLAARKSGKIDLSILDALDEFHDINTIPELSSRQIKGTAIAPPTSLTMNATPSTTDSHCVNKTKDSASHLDIDGVDTQSAAAKIMAKMGYKRGQGLGKDEQGISEPLEIEQTQDCISRIVSAQANVEPQISANTGATRILLLQNMVGPGEVDDDLEAETKEECRKYGQVVRCLIYEIKDKRVPEQEAVRIFVEFKDINATRKAINDLNGRYFGGRVVKATFYNENKFRKYELAP